MPSGRVSAGRAHCPAPRPRRPCRSGLKAWWRRTRSPKTERIRRRATPRVVRAFSGERAVVAAAALGAARGRHSSGRLTHKLKGHETRSNPARRFSLLVSAAARSACVIAWVAPQPCCVSLGPWRSPATVQQVGTALWRLANSLLPLGGQPDLSCLCPGCRRPALRARVNGILLHGCVRAD